MKVLRPDLTAAILALRDELVAAGEYASFAAINAGYCSDFAGDVVERLGGHREVENISEVGIDSFMLPDENDEEPTVMDRALLARHWPKVVPPEGLDWDDVDRLSLDADFSCGTHTWLLHEGRHYDAEAPEGVDNLFDLPFFRRVVGSWLDERPAPTP